jgi:hypothetical protein
VQRGHGSVLCALALALERGGRGLLFRPIERTHAEKAVRREGIGWPVTDRDSEKETRIWRSDGAWICGMVTCRRVTGVLVLLICTLD